MAFSVTRPDLYFWKLNSLNCTNKPYEMHGYEFSIFVSQNFLDAVKRSRYDEKTVQEVTREIANEAGILGLEGMDLLRFGKFGIHQFTHPQGSGVWLSLDPPGSGEKGAIYSSHNCDRADQQSLLLKMWKYYADFVEGHAPAKSSKHR
jgi:hypothetical protein